MPGFRRLPSPALLVGLIALVAALSGSAVALPGKNKVDKNDIRRNAVGEKQIRAGAVGSSEAKNDGLTGSDIKEATLARVPSAARADSAASADTAASATQAGAAATAADATAIEGQRIATFTTFMPNNQSNANIANLGGIQFKGNCNFGGIQLNAHNSSGQEARIMIEGEGAPFGDYFAEDSSFTSGDATPIIEPDSDRGQVTVSALFADGSVTTAVVSGGTAGNIPAGCRIWGRVTSG